MGLAVDRKDRIYVADVGHKRVVVFDRSGKYIGEWSVRGWDGTSFVEPCIAIDRSGLVYVSDPTGNRIIKYDRSGAERGKVTGKLDLSIGIALGDGYLYVTEAGANKVRKLKR